MLHIANVVLDATDAPRLATFWSAALAWEIAPGANEFFAMLINPIQGNSPARLLIGKVPEAKSAKNRCHLDFCAADPSAEIVRLLELGASRLHDNHEHGVQWTTLADPEGNEFCVSQSPAGAQP